MSQAGPPQGILDSQMWRESGVWAPWTDGVKVPGGAFAGSWRGTGGHWSEELGSTAMSLYGQESRLTSLGNGPPTLRANPTPPFLSLSNHHPHWPEPLVWSLRGQSWTPQRAQHPQTLPAWELITSAFPWFLPGSAPPPPFPGDSLLD